MAKRCLIALALLLHAAAQTSDLHVAHLLAAKSPAAIPDEYIVIFNRWTSDEEVQRHWSMIHVGDMINNTITIIDRFRIGSFHGYSAHLSENALAMVLAMREVAYVERNQEVKASEMVNDCTVQPNATWGIVRTTHTTDWKGDGTDSMDYTYASNADGHGVVAYVIDTGIFTQHPEFEGRASIGLDVIDNPPPPIGDPNGHGTHMAGTIMSKTYGLAKRATAKSVRVLSATGSGSTAGVIEGINWVAADHKSRGTNAKSVANMSLGGGKSVSLEDAINAAVEAGVQFTVAAGGERGDACNSSPAGAKNCITVAGSDITDKFASFSSYGECVDIIAPGVTITSTWNDGHERTISGTSTAAPHVAGVIAKYLSGVVTIPTSEEIKTHIKNIATKDKVTGVPDDTANELVYYPGCQEVVM